jgi:lipopolysaccharide export LptBFGC system permease protein LptF
MERKLKFSEFAELIGTTAKTVYKMEEREEITTVIEKVNNRPTRLVVTDDNQINHFKNIYSKSPVNNSNYEENVTINNEVVNNNDSSQSANNNEIIQEMFDKMIVLNEEYNNRISKLNEELIDSKSKLLLLEDKANREGLYLAEINTLKKENNELKLSKSKSLNILVTVIIILLMVVVSMVTYNVTVGTKKERTQQEVTQSVNEIQPTGNKPVKSAVRKK